MHQLTNKYCENLDLDSLKLSQGQSVGPLLASKKPCPELFRLYAKRNLPLAASDHSINAPKILVRIRQIISVLSHLSY